ncbi:hypothetical protein A9K58_05970 [Stenotrophomonas maltophilia]|uniref:Outer membrane protein beta-barrel domain-containing protein n=1 Tax=Stenotrophomonas maltophilia TaxID=40324 RepID=A0A1A6Y070_STEMA|nr:outer membrane beta-barrel protein [Stenotrophomonas maltophilia]OBU68365.1 hypothetical protein A9K58_05970 [Stenotrophomonas maltophilia]
MKKHIVPLAIATACLAAPLSASAADREGLYGFAGMGMTSIDAEFSTGGDRRDQSANGTTVLAGAGYRMSRHLAVEADAHSMVRKADLGALGRVASYGVRGSVVGIVPIGEKVELFGKVSVGAERTRWGAGSDKVSRNAATTVNLGTGVGARYWLSPNTGISLGIDAVPGMKINGTRGRGELSGASVGAGAQHQF